MHTADWASRSIGSTTRSTVYTATSTSRHPLKWLDTKGVSTSTQLSERELFTPDEVMRLDADLALLLEPGSKPAAVRKVRYFADGEFKGLFDAG